MNEYLWPAVAAFVAVLLFLRFRPPGPPVKLKRVRVLERKLKKLEVQHQRHNRDLLAEIEIVRKAGEEVKSQVARETSELLQKFADDMTELKGEFTSIKNKAHFRDVVDGTKKERATGA